MLTDPTTLMQCLADRTRLSCVLLIQREGELCVCELMAALGLSQPKISRHLSYLKKHQMLIDRRQGHWVFYRLHPDLPHWVNEMILIVGKNNADCIEPFLQQLQQMGDRPSRSSLCCP